MSEQFSCNHKNLLDNTACFCNYTGSYNAEEGSYSTGVVIGITSGVTLLVSVVFTLLMVCLVYKIKARRGKRILKAETPSSANSIVSANDDVVYENPGNISTGGDQQVAMQPNPAYGVYYQKDQ